MQKPEDLQKETKQEDKNLKKCRNCYYHVKKGIRRCPYCGILNPTLEQKEIWYIMGGILLVMGIYTYIIR